MNKLGEFQKNIALCLIKEFEYSQESACEIINRYIEAINKIDLELSSEEWAEQLDYADKNDITLEKWLRQIRKIDKQILNNSNRKY